MAFQLINIYLKRKRFREQEQILSEDPSKANYFHIYF
jgi:hypothetical protein